MSIRHPAVAGRFYPADQHRLNAALDRLLGEAPSVEGILPPRGLLVPHAGWLFSGQIAADAFKAASKGEYGVVVIFGANHTAGGFGKVALPTSNAFASPVGTLPIDSKVIERLADDPLCHKDDRPHSSEHSIEVQLPFLCRLFPDVPIVPCIIGTTDLEDSAAFGERAAMLTADRDPLFVASSDLSHYPDGTSAKRLDSEVVGAIEAMDLNGFQEVVRRFPANSGDLSTRACGDGAIAALIGAMQRLGAACPAKISTVHSGETIFGESDRVVGYASLGFFEGEVKFPTPSPAEGNPGRALLSFARKTLDFYLNGEVVPLPRGLPATAEEHRGVFVTLYNQESLRGCVGHILSDEPLGKLTGRMAIAAATDDYRFREVAASEIPDLRIELSILSEPKPVGSVSEIEPMRDGVVIRKSGRQGVFLPKVAQEQGWDRETLLDRLCEKAGLARGSWRKGAELLTFQAEIFREDE